MLLQSEGSHTVALAGLSSAGIGITGVSTGPAYSLSVLGEERLVLFL